MITGIHHTSFSVSDMDRAVNFYCEGLGFQFLNRREVSGPTAERVSGVPGAHLIVVHLRGHGTGLELIQYVKPRGVQRAPRPNDVGSGHLCYIVDDIDAEIARLKTFGATFISAPETTVGGPNDGNRYVYFTDPDGIPMELPQPARKQD